MKVFYVYLCMCLYDIQNMMKLLGGLKSDKTLNSGLLGVVHLPQIYSTSPWEEASWSS